MALFSKARGILKQTLSNHISKEIAASTPSIFQVIRCMSTKLFVGGINFSTDETSLREEFSKYGDIAEIRIIYDRNTGNSRGFGFITYISAEDASSAIQAMDQKEFHGRRLRVNYANDRARGYVGGGGYIGGTDNYGYGGGNVNFGGGNYAGGNYRGGGDYGVGSNEGYGTAGGDSGNYRSGNYGGGGYRGGNTEGYVTPGGDNYASSGGSYSSAGNFTGGGSGHVGSGETGFGSGGQYPIGNDYVSGNQNFGVASGGGGSDTYKTDVTSGNGAFANSGYDQNQGFSTDAVDQFGDDGRNGLDDADEDFNSEGNYKDENDPENYADRRA